MCEPQTFKLNATEYAALQAKAEASGLMILGDSGTTSAHGCEVSWNYDVAEGELTAQCLSKPFFVSCETINQKLRELIEG